MIHRATPEAALCLHLVASLCLEMTLPSERVTPLAILRDHGATLDALNRPELAVAVRRMIAAATPWEWTAACTDAARALVPIHRAEAARLIGATATKRMAG